MHSIPDSTEPTGLNSRKRNSSLVIYALPPRFLDSIFKREGTTTTTTTTTIFLLLIMTVFHSTRVPSNIPLVY